MQPPSPIILPIPTNLSASLKVTIKIEFFNPISDAASSLGLNPEIILKLLYSFPFGISYEISIFNLNLLPFFSFALYTKLYLLIIKNKSIYLAVSKLIEIALKNSANCE